MLCARASVAAANIPTIVSNFKNSESPKLDAIWALIGQTGNDAIDLFCHAIKDVDKYVRWAASETLSKCSNQIATDALVSSLKDRSTLVKGVAVSAMKRQKPKTTVSQLTRIVKSQHLMNHLPGIVGDATEALRLITNVG
ncbi:MAG: HEAT repeat domain-containing protein [Planctomycetaceae bacterium]|nr:HEAT repeat domain-containing protein [Planctomycetaceae bacterium]